MEESVAAKRIFLLSGHTAFREKLALVLNETSDLEVVAQAGSLAEMGEVNLDHNIDVALVDLPLSEGEGMALIRQLSTHHGDAVALVLSSSVLAAPSGIVRALGAGAVGVLSTSTSLEEILEAIRSSAGSMSSIARGAAVGSGRG
jgi:DNA-binding NarL/FixJ family response regulator